MWEGGGVVDVGTSRKDVKAIYTANHGNMHVHFNELVTSLRRNAESYLLVHKVLLLEHVT